MRLLASTDLALRVLMLLATAPDARVSVSALSRTLGGVSQHHLHKIVQDLAALGVVRTARGAGGGVTLARPAAEVRLGALVRALEADHPMVECFRDDGGACTLSPACRLRHMLGDAQAAFHAALDRRTLADCAIPSG